MGHIQKSASYTLQFLRYGTDKMLEVKVTMARSKVKSRSHHDAQLHPPTNVLSKFQLPTAYGFREKSLDKILMIKVTNIKVKTRSHHDIAYLHNIP